VWARVLCSEPHKKQGHKQTRCQTLHVALFNLCYMFYIVFVKHIKWCIVSHIIVQMVLGVDGVCAGCCETWTENSGSKLAIASSAGDTVISPSMARLVGYHTKSAIPTIFDKLCDAKPKRISSLMEKLNRKRICVSDNRVILRENYWIFTSSRIRE